MGAEPTTPPPVYYAGPDPPVARPSPMAPTERSSYRQAAWKAAKVYPGPIGELVSRELQAFDEFGWVLANGSLLTRVRDVILQEWDKWDAAQRAERAKRLGG